VPVEAGQAHPATPQTGEPTVALRGVSKTYGDGEVVVKARLERAKEAFRELADVLWQKFHGRVYLVKNVFASKETLAAMYGDHAVESFRLKRELDPGGVLRDPSLERTFGDLI